MRNMNAAEFAAHIEAYGLRIVEEKTKEAHVERAVDSDGCTSAFAVWQGGVACYRHYNSVNDLDELIVSAGFVHEPADFERIGGTVNGTDAVRVYAADPESALAIAALADSGAVGMDNTSLGKPGAVQKILQ